MPIQLRFRAASNALVWSAVAVVVLGAVYFGIASCGGYVWHKELFRFFAAAVAVIAAIAPSRALRSRGQKAAFLGVLASGYFILEAAAAPFYPTPPQSLSEYSRLFLRALGFGSCG